MTVARIVEADRKNARAVRTLAGLLTELALVQAQQKQGAESVASLTEATALVAPLVDREPDDLDLQALAAGIYMRIGQAETERKNPQAALGAQRAARPILERLVTADPNALKWKGALAFAMSSNGHTLIQAKRVDDRHSQRRTRRQRLQVHEVGRLRGAGGGCRSLDRQARLADTSRPNQRQ